MGNTISVAGTNRDSNKFVARKQAKEDAIETEIRTAKVRLYLVEPHDAFLARTAPFVDVVLNIARKICASLVVLAFLAVLVAVAAALIPWVRTQVDKLFGKALDLPEKREGGEPGPRYPGYPFQATPLMAAAPLAVAATAAGAAAAFVIGVLTITVPSRNVTANVAAPSANAKYSIDDIDIHIPRIPVNVPPTMISPHVNADVPPLAFNFPQIPVDDTALRQFTTAMTEFAQALKHQSDHDARLDALSKAAEDLAARNAELTTKVALQPTENQVTQMEKELVEIKKTNSAIRDALSLLAQSTEKESTGTTVGALQYLRSLNAQNDRLLNQLFRPGLVKQNCETYGKVAKTANVDVVSCTEKGWRDFWRFVTRQANAGGDDHVPGTSAIASGAQTTDRRQ